MVFPGHIAGGYLAAKAVISAFHPAVTPDQTVWLYIIGTIAGEFPDLDVAWFYMTKVVLKTESKENHRDQATHAPVVWLAISMIIVTVGLVSHSTFVRYIGWMVLAGTMSHFLLDSIEYGIKWLWPLSDKRFCLREVRDPEISAEKGSLSYYLRFVFEHYPRRASFYAEIAVVVVAIFFLVK